MDRRVIRSKKNKSRNVGPYDRPNQGILGKVASKVKDLTDRLAPSWIFNVSQWISTPQEQPGSTNAGEEESEDEDEIPPETTTTTTTAMSSSTHGSKRLRLHEPASSILSQGPQAWLDAPSSSNLFNQPPHLPSTATQNALVENKESPVIMNGDDHSENSEGSASTSGCSSLVSSHKERSNCLGPSSLRLSESALANLRGTLKNTIDAKHRRDLMHKEEFPSPNTSASRLSLWSGGLSPAAKFHRRSPSVASSSQPGFNVSAFVAPSKINQQMERKVASPFYQGRTSFGGASSARKTPTSSAPYQTDRPPRNQIRVRTNQSEDSLEGMSSAAKRILLTLEKMSSPVTDAKKIPNTNRSPVDLSLYMMPPKHRSNVVSSPAGSSKGPPIANISTISKLTTLKSCGTRKFQNTTMESLPVPSEEKNKIPADIFPSDLLQTSLSKGGGGGKMKSKITQQHQPTIGSSSLEQLESVQLPNVPLPISTLPTFSFGPKPDKSSDFANKMGGDFVFSSPIEVLPKVPVYSNISVPNPDSNLQRSSVSQEKPAFTFSSPIEHELPSPILGGVFTTNSSSMWECATCWVRNPSTETKCKACESPKPTLNSTEPKLPISSTPATKPLKNSASASSWNCSECWVNNPAEKLKCLACETPKPGAKVDTTSNSTSKSSSLAVGISSIGTSGFFSNTYSTSSGGFKLPDITCDSSDQPATFGGFKLPAPTTDQTATFGGFKLPSTKPSDAETNISGVKTSDIFTSKLSEDSKSSPSKNSDLSTLESIAKSVCSSKNTASSTLNGPSKVSFETKQPNKVENLISDKEKTNSNFSFKTNATTTSSAAVIKPLSMSKPPGSWECDTCMVVNTSEKQKCAACETLRPSKTNMSGLKDPESFKFSSPLQSSPITFKFNPSSTSQTAAVTTTSSTFAFGSNSSATSTFFTSVLSTTASVSSINEPKTVSQTETTTPKPSVPEFKFETPKVPLLDTSKPNIPVIDLADKNENTDAKPSLFSIPASKSSNEESLQPSITSSGNSAFKITTPTVGNTNLTPFASTENKLTLPFTVPSKTDIHEADPKKPEMVSSGPLKDAPIGGFNFKIPSSAAPAFGGFGTSNLSSDNKLTSQLKSDTEEKKPDPTLGVNVSTPSLSSPFSKPISTPVFKTGDKVEVAKTSEAPTIKNVFASSVGSSSATTTTPTFNFTSTPISVSGLAPTSSQSSLSATPAHSFGTMAKSPDMKTVASVAPFNAVATTGTFTFGTPAVTTAQSNTSSGFSFFTSSAANATPTTTQSLFMFGNSNASQTSTTGGFTFKGLNEEKPAAATSNALTFNTPATTSSTSSLFKFNASAPTSTSGFVFGAVKSEPGTASVPTGTFAFGSGGAQPTNSTFSGFQTNPTAAPAFQFGNQPAANNPPAPTFGSNTSTFSFGKTEATNQLPTTQASSGFGVNTIQPMFGGATAPAFGNKTSDKPVFNFGMPQGSSTPVFQFGEKKQATASQVFGTPAQETTAPASAFPAPQFNFNTPANFNFGASANNAGPFQFAASTTDTQSSSAPRKIRKAVRRVPR